MLALLIAARCCSSMGDTSEEGLDRHRRAHTASRANPSFTWRAEVTRFMAVGEDIAAHTVPWLVGGAYGLYWHVMTARAVMRNRNTR